jgi:putative peptidoglycan lipid II flippase
MVTGSPLSESTPSTSPDGSNIVSQPSPQETGRIAQAAGILALGNIVSRVLGLIRETVKSHFFGAGGAVDAFGVATIVPTMLYDLLIGGMVNGALVPVFSEYAEKDREGLWELVSVLLNLTVVVLAVFVLLVELFASQVVFLLSSGSSPEVHALATRLLRITVPAVLFLSLSGVLSGLLYALKRFSYPAFTAAVFNGSIVSLALIFHQQLDISAMALGLLVGAVMQVLLQMPGLRDARLRLRLTFKHPGLRRIALLYLPSLLPLAVDVLISRPISYSLASQTGEGGISWMGYATYLTQLPQGLVATAISLAVLPTLSSHAANERINGNGDAFRKTLAHGLRLVLVLIIPATVGLFILARPTVALLYEHGDFLAHDTQMTARALQFYLLGLPFAAVDLLLVFAFYARQDTLTPSLIGVGTILVYLLTAVLLLPHLGLFSLMVADSFKHFLHTCISALFLRKKAVRLAGYGIYRTLGLVLVGAGAMGLITYSSLSVIQLLVPAGVLSEVLMVVVPSVAGAGTYLTLIMLVGVEEVKLLWHAVLRRLSPAV